MSIKKNKYGKKIFLIEDPDIWSCSAVITPAVGV